MKRIFVLRTEERLTQKAANKLCDTVKAKFAAVGDDVEVLVLHESFHLDEATDHRRTE